MKRSIPHILFLSASISLGLLSTAAVGNLITLMDGNSVVKIDPDPTSTGVKGVNSWSVNGVNQLQQQWFGYKIGSSTLASIDTLASSGGSMTTTTAAEFPGIASITYSNTGQGLSINVTYVLTGGSSLDGQSDLGESIKIINTSTGPQTIHFIQASNFDLEGTPGGDSLKSSMGFDGKVNAMRQTKGGGLGASKMETVVTPAVDLYLPLPLSLPGPDDTGCWFQWDRTIPAGGTFLISQDNLLNVVPEPSTFALLLGAGLGLIGYVWRRRSLGL